MFSKSEAQQLKTEFWTAFGKAFPRKWILYDTKLKDVSFKFYADTKKAEVSFNIECKEELYRNAYFEKIESLETILRDDFLPEAIFQEHYYLDNGKEIAKIWVEIHGVSIYRKETWQKIFEFFVQNMEKFEYFYFEYEDFIKDI